MQRLIILLACSAISLGGQHLASGQSHHHHDHYTFGARSHTERLAQRLYTHANTVCWDAYLYYQHEHDWHDTYHEMYMLLQDVQRIRQMIHDDYHHGQHEHDHIAATLLAMDQLFHHIEDDVAYWSPHYRRYHHSPHPYPHHHSRLREELRHLEETLHGLMQDYGVHRVTRPISPKVLPPLP